MRRSAAGCLLLLILLAPGCDQSRTFTIYSNPADAKLVIDGVERGPGPITQRFNFDDSDDFVRVMATREGYLTKTERLTPDTPDRVVVLKLDPLGPKAIITIEPAALVRVNGRLYRPMPVRQAEITRDPSSPNTTYTVTAEQTGYAREEMTLRATDRQGYYRMVLRPLRNGGLSLAQNGRPRTQPATRQAPAPAVAPETPMRRTVVIRTDPPVDGAEIFVAGEKRGDREVELTNHPFVRDPATGRSTPQTVRATAPGFRGGEVTMRFEDGKGVYVIPLGARRKEIRIVTDPPGAIVTLDGRELPRDRDGVSTETLTFPPADPPDRQTTFAAVAKAGDPAAPYEVAQLGIGWDDGRRDYSVTLPPSLVVTVPMLRAVPAWSQGSGWRAGAEHVETIATRDPSTGEAPGAVQPLAHLPEGTLVDSVIASPEGTLVLYTELLVPDADLGSGPLRSRLRLLNSDGTRGPPLASDGKAFDAMPSFTPDGSEIVFTSDRSGEGLDVWTMKVGSGAARQIARGGEKAGLWPMIDASPRPRLFYEEFLKPAVRASESRSEVHVVELESDPPTNKALSPGSRPRASPRADAVVFTRVDAATGKRDLYLISDKDGVPLAGSPANLTNTPEVDEFDPTWSRTGGKIAFASDAGADDSNRRNYDIYVMTVADPQSPVRVTRNASWDDSPAWDPTGKSLYFRSNRAGKWGIWKAGVP